jgi:glycosyltransferase involved in cell wall biosynthesis
VGDQAEPRKRVDRAIEIFSRVRQRNSHLRLVFVGNRSHDALMNLPDEIIDATEFRGYVSEDELRRAYAESAGLILLSDYEAFGLPIIEALASGTPVFVSDNPVLRSLFHGFCGVSFCPPESAAAAEVIHDQLARGLAPVVETFQERERLRAAFSWDAVADLHWHALGSAWTWRRGLAWTQ